MEELLEKLRKISEICKEPADNMQVLELQARILRVLTGKEGNND